MADCHCEGDRKDANQRVAGRDRLVMLSEPDPSLRSRMRWLRVTIGSTSQTLRCAQGDSVRSLRLMRIRADKSAMGAVNRPLQPWPDEFVNVHYHVLRVGLRSNVTLNSTP